MTGSARPEVELGGPLAAARFLRRPNRFVVRCRLQETGEEVRAHLPDPGRLTDLLVSGRPVRLRPEEGRDRKTEWTAVLVQAEAGRWVSVDTTLPNRLVERALRHGALTEVSGWEMERTEVTVGDSRFDFLLREPEGRRLLLEVKSVTLVRDGVGLFPDAVTERGSRHVRELAHATGRDGWTAGVLFVAQRGDVCAVRAAARIDAEFAAALDEARRRGVETWARRCRVTRDRVRLGASVPVR